MPHTPIPTDMMTAAHIRSQDAETPHLPFKSGGEQSPSTTTEHVEDFPPANRCNRSQSLGTPPIVAVAPPEPQSTPPPATAMLQQCTPQRAHSSCSQQDSLRRTMSAEFKLSLLQEELGYPRRKLSRPRRSSIESDANSSHRPPRASRHRLSSKSRGQSADTSDDDSSGHARSLRRSSVGSMMNTPPSSRHGLRLTNRSEPDPEQDQSNEQTFSDDELIDTRVDSEDEKENRPRVQINKGLTQEEEEHFLDRRVAHVSGYTRDTDGVVYYEIMVQSEAYGPLSTYKVRRRYSEFRDLYRGLSQMMSRCSSRAESQAQLQSIDEMSSEEMSSESTVALPPLPDKGGMWAYLQFDHVSLLDRRAEYFNLLLKAAQKHKEAKRSWLLSEFLGMPPDAIARHMSVENSYVSLNRFSAPQLGLQVELQERRQMAKHISMKRSSLGEIFAPLESTKEDERLSR